MRENIPKSVRFEVLKRDKFTCQYCGARAPEVALVIDHIVPASKDGNSDILNLITSCDPCNSGKSNKELKDDSAIKIQLSQMDKLQERREQLSLLLQWREGLEQLGKEEVDSVQNKISRLSGCGLSEYGREQTAKLIKKYGVIACLDAAETAFSRYFTPNADVKANSASFSFAFQKMGAILHIREKSKKDPLLPVLYQMRGGLKRRHFYWNSRTQEWKSLLLLRQLFEYGYAETEIWAIINASTNWSSFESAVVPKESTPCQPAL